MPNPASPGVAAIQAAYQEQVQNLFKVFTANLGDEAVTRENDQKCVEKFVRGITIAKRAKELALAAVAGVSPGKAAATRKKFESR
jgi:hypothetical protein